MNDLIDGIGTATEGGLFARALEPDSGAKQPHPDQPERCHNCGTELTGAYCHACGQKGHLHRTIGAFMHDLLHGALHFEGKFWRTLPMLVFRPGKLTRRYIDGERARFVSPMALFLFGVFLMFAVFQMMGVTTPTNPSGESDSEGLAFVEGVQEGWAQGAAGDEGDDAEPQDAAEMIARARADIIAQRDEAQAELDALPEDDPARQAAEERLQDAETGLQFLEAGETIATGDTPRSGNISTTTGVDWIDEKLVAKWQDNPGLMLYKLQANGYKFSWLLIPISIPFVWLLFAWKRRFKAYDHAIFVTYSISFVTLLFITISLLTMMGEIGVAIAGLLPLAVPIHLYKQLRHAYELSRFSAFWRLMVLSAFIWIVIALFIQVLLMLGAF